MRQMPTLLFSFVLLVNILNAETTAVQRDAFFLTNELTSSTATPSTLQYYDFKENLPDEISIDVYNNREFSNLAGKRIFVGYGVVDPTGDDCKVFPPSVTGQANDITICLPWWRIEREYQITSSQGTGATFTSFLSRMQRPRPPKNVSVCDTWDTSQVLPGGTVTCTTYYDKSISDECFNKPLQAQCRKDTCGIWVKNNCARDGRSIGFERASLDNVQFNSTNQERFESKVNLTTEQFICPGGSFTEHANCTNEKTVAMNPYECKPDDPATPLEDSIMKYCDETRPVRDVASGAITGFVGTCPAEASPSHVPFDVTCSVNSFSQTKNTCTKYASNITTQTNNVVAQTYDLHYTEQRVNVLSGAVDRFSSRDDCIRANTVVESRNPVTHMLASASGSLDDDIYLIVHSADDTHQVVYCNQQHNINQGSKLNFPELGGVVSCIQNNGDYNLSQEVTIKLGDIVSIQQATEAEDSGWNGTAGAFEGRTHFMSSKVVIDGVEAAPQTYLDDFPFYPRHYPHLKTWENTLGSLSIMFPYSGSYSIFFYTEGGELVASKNIGSSDFASLNATGFKQFFLAKDMEIAPTLDASNTATLCLNDNWTDYGGGVFNGKGSISGEACQEPSAGNAYQKSKAIKRVVVKDLLTGSFTVIPLVYPLGFPNRVFISKVNLYEDRIYHCYDEPAISAPLGN